MGKLVNLTINKYNSYNISEKKLIEMLNEATVNITGYNKDLATDIAIMDELDKLVCLYLKERIFSENLDDEILVIEKYKYLFSVLKIDANNNIKEKLLIDAIKSYDGKLSFAVYASHYIRKNFVLENKKKSLDINKLKEKISNQKSSESKNIAQTGYLYKYFYDIDEIVNNDKISLYEKTIILLKFGYIDNKFYSDKFISELLNVPTTEVRKVILKYEQKLKVENDEEIKEHYVKKFNK